MHVHTHTQNSPEGVGRGGKRERSFKTLDQYLFLCNKHFSLKHDTF